MKKIDKNYCGDCGELQTPDNPPYFDPKTGVQWNTSCKRSDCKIGKQNNCPKHEYGGFLGFGEHSCLNCGSSPPGDVGGAGLNNGFNSMRVKNYCVCKVKGNILYREMDCPAKYIHNGVKFVEIGKKDIKGNYKVKIDMRKLKGSSPVVEMEVLDPYEKYTDPWLK